jgi:hypothetical protein
MDHGAEHRAHPARSDADEQEVRYLVSGHVLFSAMCFCSVRCGSMQEGNDRLICAALISGSANRQFLVLTIEPAVCSATSNSLAGRQSKRVDHDGNAGSAGVELRRAHTGNSSHCVRTGGRPEVGNDRYRLSFLKRNSGTLRMTNIIGRQKPGT